MDPAVGVVVVGNTATTRDPVQTHRDGKRDGDPGKACFAAGQLPCRCCVGQVSGSSWLPGNLDFSSTAVRAIKYRATFFLKTFSSSLILNLIFYFHLAQKQYLYNNFIKSKIEIFNCSLIFKIY